MLTSIRHGVSPSLPLSDIDNLTASGQRSKGGETGILTTRPGNGLTGTFKALRQRSSRNILEIRSRLLLDSESSSCRRTKGVRYFFGMIHRNYLTDKGLSASIGG